MVIKEISKLWMEEKKLYVKESTYSAYCLLLINHILPTFGERELFVESEVQEFALNKIKEGLNQKTVKDIVVVLKMIQKFGAKLGYMPLNIIDIKYPIINENQALPVMAKDNQKKLMDYLKRNFSFKNLGIMICLSTGLRIGEICALRWSDFDLETKVLKVRHSVQRLYIIDGQNRHTEIRVTTPKTKESNRDIPLSSFLWQVIKPLVRVVNKECFVLSNDKKPIEPRTYRNYFKKLLKELGFPEIKFHGLRHSFATRCIESKNDYKTVSVLLGHSNITTTLNLYVHPNNEEKKKCIEKMLKDLV